MQSVMSRIWTLVAVSISCDDNHYTTSTYIKLLIGLKTTTSQRAIRLLSFDWSLHSSPSPVIFQKNLIYILRTKIAKSLFKHVRLKTAYCFLVKIFKWKRSSLVIFLMSWSRWRRKSLILVQALSLVILRGCAWFVVVSCCEFLYLLDFFAQSV